MRIGKRKAIAAAGLIGIAAVAVTAWLLWGTDGLLATTLVTLLLSILGLGWLVVQSQRQISVLLGESRSISKVDTVAAAGWSGDQAEQLLRAVHAGFTRLDHVLDTLVSEWQETREELLSSVVRTVDEELGKIRRSMMTPPGGANVGDANTGASSEV